MRALGRIAVDRADVLRVAQRALDGSGADGDLDAGAVLPSLLAALAGRDGDLKLRAAGRRFPRRTVEHRAAQLSDQLILREARAMLVIEHLAYLAQQRERLCRDLES